MLKNQHGLGGLAGLLWRSTDRFGALPVYVTMTSSGLMVIGFLAALIAGVPAQVQHDAATIALPTRVDPSTGQLLIGVDAAGGRLRYDVRGSNPRTPCASPKASPIFGRNLAICKE